jgi:hypothetical protein
MRETQRENLEEIVAFRLCPDERKQLEKEAGGPSKVSAYLRGLVRGARIATFHEFNQEPERVA